MTEVFFLKNSIERVFNFIRFIDINHIRFNSLRNYKNKKKAGVGFCRQDC